MEERGATAPQGAHTTRFVFPGSVQSVHRSPLAGVSRVFLPVEFQQGQGSIVVCSVFPPSLN